MKTYTLNQIKNICKEQDYKLAALESPQGERIIPFNQIKVNINKQLEKFPIRLKSELQPDGVYFILLAHSINTAKSPDRYPMLKGKVSPDELADIEKKNMQITPVIVEKHEHVLTWDSALAMQQEIANLKTENAILKESNNNLLIKVDELEAELEDQEEQGLSEDKPKSSIQSFLSDAMPQLIPIADRYFALEEKKLDLELLKHSKQNNPSNGTKKGFKPIIPGTQEHLNLIEHYFNTNNDVKLNEELDKLEEVNPDLCKVVCEKLGLQEEEEAE